MSKKILNARPLVLSVELTEQERNGWAAGNLFDPNILVMTHVKAIEFELRPDGVLKIKEVWFDKDETWDNGVTVHIPPRVLNVFMKWFCKIEM